jgi:TPR repeat protein
LIQLDMAELLATLSAGTSVRLDAGWIARLWQVPAMDVKRPYWLAKTGAPAAPMIFAAAVTPGAAYELGSRDEELAAHGLTPLKGGNCVLREGSPGPAILCGERASLLAFESSLVPSADSLAAGTIVQLSSGLTRSLASDLYEGRAAVPRNIDPLLPARSAVDQMGLRLGLYDVGFELVQRLIEGYEGLGPLKLSVVHAADKLALTATLEPVAASIASRSIEGARPARVPAAFWELSEDTETAIFFDASLLTPFLQPSPRALGLFAQARAGGFVDELTAVSAACLRADTAVVLASCHRPAPVNKPQKPYPPELQEFPTPPAPTPTSYDLLGIEDGQGACGKALALALDSYERQALVPGQSAAQVYFRRLSAEKPLPKSTRLFSMGWGKEPKYVGIGERKGALWLAQSSDLELLKTTLSDLLVPGPKRRSLKARVELASLGRAPTLLSGFLPEDTLPFSRAWQESSGGPQAASSTPPAKSPKRVSYAVVRDGRAVRLNGELDLAVVRRSFAKMIATAWASPALSGLTGPRHETGLSLLDAACHFGDGSACNWLGITYADGRGVSADLARALPLLELGCEQGFGMACTNLAFYRKADKAEELKLFQRACELGSKVGCAWWGVRLVERDGPGEKREAFEKLQMGCDGFVGWACARIGAHYRDGIVLVQNERKGADFQERACELGFGSGCVELANAFTTGKGRATDASRAFELLQKACELDKANGCYALGHAYLQGRGTAKDEAAARERFNTACEASHAEACRELAEMAGEP